MRGFAWLRGFLALGLISFPLVACTASDDADEEDEPSSQTQDPLVFGGYCINIVSPNTCDPSVFCGDLNADRRVTSTDGTLALRLVANDGYDFRADVNGDGKVTLVDAQMILRKASGQAVTFNCKRARR